MLISTATKTDDDTDDQRDTVRFRLASPSRRAGSDKPTDRGNYANELRMQRACWLGRLQFVAAIVGRNTDPPTSPLADSPPPISERPTRRRRACVSGAISMGFNLLRPLSELAKESLAAARTGSGSRHGLCANWIPLPSVGRSAALERKALA